MAISNWLKSFLSSSRVDVHERYELLRKGVAGTMSKFYMARDRKTGEVVGLKILDPAKTAFFEARFKGLKKPLEGEIAIRFDHPNIVKTLEFGLTTKGEHYLVMEFLGGPGMNFVLGSRDEAHLAGRRVMYTRHAAEALHTVHESGFIHRDICPRNLILTADTLTLKLTDFGLTVPDTPPFHQPGNRTGTPNYMAPELVRRYPTDRRLDIFAFGVTIYEMFTYELPWMRGTTGMAAMTHDQPPMDIRKHRPKIHSRLAQAIHSCIEPDAKKRCPTMEQFLQTIRGIEQEEG